MILVWSWRAIAESLHTRRGHPESEEPVNNWLYPKFGNLYSLLLPRDQRKFLFFIGYGYSNVSLLCFPLVTVHVHVLFVPRWILAQAHFYGWTYLPPFAESNYVHRSRWYSDTHLVDIIYGRMKLSATSVDTPAGHGDIPVITLLTLSSAGWSCQRHPLCSIPAVHVNILH